MFTTPTTVGEQPGSDLLRSATDHDLRLYHREGFNRYGIVAAILDEDHRLLLEQHRGSTKATEGMWGPLAETTKVYQYVDRTWAVEPTINTLLRGIEEETGVVVPESELLVPLSGGSFDTTWPVGVSHRGQEAAARCPVVVVSNDVKQQILDARATVEIIDTQFVTIEAAINNDFVRPGTREWLAAFTLHYSGVSFDQAATVPVETWFNTEHPRSMDALLTEMYGELEPAA